MDWITDENMEWVADWNLENELRNGVSTVNHTGVKLSPVRFLKIRKAEDEQLAPCAKNDVCVHSPAPPPIRSNRRLRAWYARVASSCTRRLLVGYYVFANG